MKEISLIRRHPSPCPTCRRRGKQSKINKKINCNGHN
jgi:hypothetical protein